MAGRERDKAYPHGRYLIVDEDGKGHLPVKDTDDGPVNHRLMGAAWAALHGGYRGYKYEGPGQQEALANLKGIYKSEGLELPGELFIGTSGHRIIGSSGGEEVNRWTDGPMTFVLRLSALPALGLARIPVLVTGSWVKTAGKFPSLWMSCARPSPTSRNSRITI